MTLFDWTYAWQILPDLLRASLNTVGITLIGFLIAIVLGLFLAIGRRSRRVWLSWPATGVIEFIRSTPLLIQVYFLYYVLPNYGVSMTAMQVGILGIGLHYACYIAEVYRGGLDAVPRAQWEAVTALKKLGLEVAMITGDARSTALAVARTVGIDRVMAEVLPDGKVAALGDLRGNGKLAFVGDGINDAPALASADVGVAIGTGTDIAIESADVVLMAGQLTGVVNALTLSKAVVRNIKQNLFWAFIYNVVLIPVAAGALYPLSGTLLSPVLAAAAMGLSSLFVLTNALRLRRFHAPLREHAPSVTAEPLTA